MGKDLYFSLKREYLHKQHEASNDTTLKKDMLDFHFKITSILTFKSLKTHNSEVK